MTLDWAMCRSQNTYPTSATEYQLDKEVGKGACGTVSPQLNYLTYHSIYTNHRITHSPSSAVRVPVKAVEGDLTS